MEMCTSAGIAGMEGIVPVSATIIEGEKGLFNGFWAVKCAG